MYKLKKKHVEPDRKVEEAKTKLKLPQELTQYKTGTICNAYIAKKRIK